MQRLHCRECIFCSNEIWPYICLELSYATVLFHQFIVQTSKLLIRVRIVCRNAIPSRTCLCDLALLGVCVLTRFCEKSIGFGELVSKPQAVVVEVLLGGFGSRKIGLELHDAALCGGQVIAQLIELWVLSVRSVPATSQFDTSRGMSMNTCQME